MFGLVCWVLWHINLCMLFNAKSIFMAQSAGAVEYTDCFSAEE